MANPEEYQQRLSALGLDDLVLTCSSAPEAAAAVETCRQLEDEVRAIEREVDLDIRSLRASYSERLASAGKGASKLSSLFGKRGGSPDAGRELRVERDAAIAPFRYVKLTIDDLLVQLTSARSQLETHFPDSAAPAGRAEPAQPGLTEAPSPGPGAVSISAVQLDTSGWNLEHSSADAIVWSDETPDFFFVDLFEVPPDLPGPPSQIDPIRRQYREIVTEEGGGLIDVDSTTVADLPALQVIAKFPQEPIGMAYVGSLVVPFRDRSFVVRVQCPEHGVTGMREAAVIEKLGLADSLIPDGRIASWARDPYDPSVEGPVLRNRAEDAEWDAAFPDHPLSRVRKHLEWLRATLRVAPELRSCAPFVGS